MTELLGRPLIRRCRAEDLRALEWGGEFREHRAIIEEAFAQAAGGEQVMWVAEVAGAPVGQLWVELGRARLWAARVQSALQGRGIGTALVRAAEQDLLGRGHARASVAVEPSNARARRFWLSQGYRLLGRVTERWSYRTPAGSAVVAAAELDVLDKELEAHAGDSLDHR
jgi:ribosomal protein S18 acetylase RimI-like enzyme